MALFIRKNKDSGQSDTELIRRYKESGDLEYLCDLYQRYMHLVYGVCLKYLKDEDAAKDAVMEIFEKLVDSLKEHAVENFSGWLHVLSRNHCLMKLRKQRDYQTINNQEIFMESDYIMHPDSETQPDDDFEQLKLALESLPEGQKECIKMFYLEKKSYKEIEETTGYEYKSIKSYIQNGRRNLKLYFENE